MDGEPNDKKGMKMTFSSIASSDGDDKDGGLPSGPQKGEIPNEFSKVFLPNSTKGTKTDDETCKVQKGPSMVEISPPSQIGQEPLNPSVNVKGNDNGLNNEEPPLPPEAHLKGEKIISNSEESEEEELETRERSLARNKEKKFRKRKPRVKRTKFEPEGPSANLRSKKPRNQSPG